MKNVLVFWGGLWSGVCAAQNAPFPEQGKPLTIKQVEQSIGGKLAVSDYLCGESEGSLLRPKGVDCRRWRTGKISAQGVEFQEGEYAASPRGDIVQAVFHSDKDCAGALSDFLRLRQLVNSPQEFAWIEEQKRGWIRSEVKFSSNPDINYRYIRLDLDRNKCSVTMGEEYVK